METKLIENNISNNSYEGMLFDPPSENKKDAIFDYQISIFPNFLICEVFTTFLIQKIVSNYKGVGILIGPSVVLTVGHNLFKGSAEVTCLKVNHTLFNQININLREIHVPEKYKIEVQKEMHKYEVNQEQTQASNEKVKNDWGLIFLPFALGDSIISLLEKDTKNDPELKVIDNLYSFFNNDRYQLINNENEICIIGTHESNTELNENVGINIDKNRIRLSILSENSDNIDENPKDTKEKMKLDKCHIQRIDENCRKMEMQEYDDILLNEISKHEKLLFFKSTGSFDKTKKNHHFEYKINTQIGDSGSPIFKNDNYEFIGLHSSSGPEEQTAQRDTLSTANGSLVNPSLKQDGISINKLINIQKGKSNMDVKYNRGVNILLHKTEIIKVVKTKFEENKSYFKKRREKSEEDYLLIKCFIKKQKKVRFLLKSSSSKNLIKIISRYLELPYETIILHNNDLSFQITNENCDRIRKLSQDSLSFSLKINKKLCGEMISKEVFDDYFSYNQVKLDKDQIVKEPKSLQWATIIINTKYLSISQTDLYNSLYKVTRDTFLSKLGFEP